MIENEWFSLKSAGLREDGSTKFMHFNKASRDTQEMAFSMKYYNPATGDDDYSHSDNDPSGAYIFKPKRDDQDKHGYSSYDHID